MLARAKRWAPLVLLFFGVLLPLIVLGVLSEEVLEREDIRLDRWVIGLIHPLASPTLQKIGLVLRFLGGAEVLGMASLLMVAYLLLTREGWKAFFFALAMGGAVGLNLLAKASFRRDRPLEALLQEPNYSFPSGHASGSMAFAMAVIVLLWPTRWRWWAVGLGMAFTLLVGISRIYLGAHYPSDVLGGWMASLAWVLGLRQVLRSRL
ncbi:MAG: hypothetical protein C4327_02385 [Meiothermus sp.]